MTWTWRWTVALAVLVGLLGSAAALVGWEPPGADDVFRRRESAACVCVRVQ